MGKFGFILLLAAMTASAQAYIDPNTGGLLAQILTPLLLALAVVWATFRRKLTILKGKMLRLLSIGVRKGDIDGKR